jgi:phytoene dehydrogenase-like protein
MAVATMASPARPIWGWPDCGCASLSGAASLAVPASLQPKVINELKLREHGLRLVERRAQNFLPLPDGRYLLTGEGRTDREIAKFSTRDAARYPAYQAEIGRLAETILTANQRLDLFRHVNFPVYELA